MKIAAASFLLLATVVPAAAQTINIFGTATPQIPVVTDDTNAVTLGTQFFSDVPGTIAGVRFYRGQGNSNGYSVNLFDKSGNRLANARPRTDVCTIPCWEEVQFAAPISIKNNQTYVAAYYTSNGQYADDEFALVNGFSTGALHAQPDGGVYVYSNGFPTLVWHSSNYYVDVLFTPANPTLMMSCSPSAPTIAAATAIGTTISTCTASWSDGSQFTGSFGFGNPYNDDNGTFALSGTNPVSVVVAKSVTGDASSVQNITVVATQ